MGDYLRNRCLLPVRTNSSPTGLDRGVWVMGGLVGRTPSRSEVKSLIRKSCAKWRNSRVLGMRLRSVVTTGRRRWFPNFNRMSVKKTDVAAWRGMWMEQVWDVCRNRQTPRPDTTPRRFNPPIAECPSLTPHWRRGNGRSCGNRGVGPCWVAVTPSSGGMWIWVGPGVTAGERRIWLFHCKFR